MRISIRPPSLPQVAAEYPPQGCASRQTFRIEGIRRDRRGQGKASRRRTGGVHYQVGRKLLLRLPQNRDRRVFRSGEYEGDRTRSQAVISEVFFWLVLIALWLAAHVAVGASLIPWWKRENGSRRSTPQTDELMIGVVVLLRPFLLLWWPFKQLIGFAIMSAEDRENKQLEAEDANYVDPEETEAKRKARAEWEAFYDASMKDK